MPTKPADLIAETLAAHPRLRPDQSLLVGVSGGRDSAVLLHALVRAGFRQAIVCHLDHALRPESRDDAAFVLKQADDYGLISETAEVDVKQLAKDEKLSIEAAGRSARYEFFAEVARAHWCPRVILAHHADDQVETFLLNLLRGSGGRGLTGMRPISIREEHGGRLEVHRPLLDVWREEIIAYADRHGVKFREDVSNLDRKFARNRVRHDLIPALSRALDRDVRRNLWRSAEILGAESDYLASQTPRLTEAELSVTDLRALPSALRRRAIHTWLLSRGVEDVSFDDIEAVRALLESTRPAKVNVAGGKHVRRRAGKLFVEG
jgi:tRNA(Ile)-lysidine synthetase-like protein